MTICRICGDELREGDDVVQLGDNFAHHACTDAPNNTPAREVLKWGAMGSTNQLGIGDVQRGG